MNIDDLTLRQAKELTVQFGHKNTCGLNSMIGEKVIVRTYSAGVHYGELIEKEGEEVILKESRRLYFWKTKNDGISLSEVSIDGLDNSSKVCSPICAIWLKAIEIIPCTKEAIKNIEDQNEYKA